MRPICVLTLGALVVGCHLDKLLTGSGGGPPPTSKASPARIVFSTPPRTAQTGQMIAPAVRVSLVDSVGVPVAGVDTTTVVVALAANPGGATLHGDTSVHPAGGIATFGNLWLDKPGTGYTLVARAAGLPDTTSTPFDITAPPPTAGSLTVTTSTTGLDLDPDGYTVTVDGTTSQPIATNNSGGVTFPGLSAGDHTVALTGVASNCTVSGGSSKTVTVPAGGGATASYAVSCTALPPTTGNIAVTTSTSGTDLDPDGYTLTVDASSQAIAINTTVTLNNLSVGNHVVALTGVASNCTVGGSASRTVAVAAGLTSTTTFTVTCNPLPPTTGDLTVTTVTTGSSLPSGGYTATLDGGASQSIGLSGNVTFPGISAGAHTIALSGVPSNCSVSPGASQTVTVPAGGTVSAPFAISCVTPPPPQNHPPVVTAGGDQTVLIGALFTLSGASFSDQDHDGPWTVTIDWGDGGSDTFAMTTEGAISGSHSYHDLLLATHTLTITVVDAHSASGTASKTVNVVASLP